MAFTRMGLKRGRTKKRENDTRKHFMRHTPTLMWLWGDVKTLRMFCRESCYPFSNNMTDV